MVIRVENLSKCYRLGQQEQRAETFVSAINGWLTAPFHNFQALRQLGQVSANDRTPAIGLIWALREVSFAVQQGEAVGIIGPNGAGKSTLLKILSRITEPSSGRAVIDGRLSSLLEVGTGFHYELTGRENIYLNGTILGMRKQEIDRKYDEIVDFSGVEKFLDTPVKRYSSGMKVRLAFAIAAHLEPEILVVDEVLAVGDAAFQKKCLGKMRDVTGEGRTVLFVSHDMSVVKALCRRGLLLQQGRLEVDGPVGQVIGQYLAAIETASSTGQLLQRTDRSGLGQVRLAQVEISAGASTGTLTTGGPSRFLFETSGFMPGLSCTFTLYNQLGQPLATFSSAAQSHQDMQRPDRDPIFICELDCLPLLPGDYHLTVIIKAGKDVQDHLTGAASFSVNPGELQGRRLKPAASPGSIFIPHRWTRPA